MKHTRAPCAFATIFVKIFSRAKSGNRECSVIRNFDKFRSNRLISTDRDPEQKFRL